MTPWHLLFVMAAGQGLFLAGVLWTVTTENRRANRLLAAICLVFSLILIDYVGYWSGLHRAYPFIAGSHIWLTLLIGPLFYHYLHVVAGSTLTRRSWLHYVPAAGSFFIQLPFYLASTEVKQAVQTQQHPPLLLFDVNPSFYYWSAYLFILWQLVAYAFLLRRRLYGHWVRDTDDVPPETGIAGRWYLLIYYLYLGFAAGYAFYYILVKTPWFSLVLDYSISLAMAVFVYSVGYLGLKQPDVFAGRLLPRVFVPAKYRTSTLTPQAADSLMRHLLDYMKQEEPFLDPDLRLGKLADALRVSTHHLSQVINEQRGQNFAEFINTYRVEYARQLLQSADYRDTFITDIGYLAGFNNKTSFYKAFRAEEGQSPAEFRRKVGNGKAEEPTTKHTKSTKG